MTERCESSIDESVPLWRPAPIRSPDACDQIAELDTALAARDRLLAFTRGELRHAIAPLRVMVDEMAALAEDAHTLPAITARAAALARDIRRLLATAHWVAEVGDLRRGTVRLRTAPADLIEIVHGVCRALAREAAACGAELVVEPGGPVTGSWDRVRLERMIACLVCNAIRHAGGRIELCVIDRGDAAELVVRDHGPGLDPASLHRLFDPTAPERQRTPGGVGVGVGVGVGLWIVRTLASAMRGSVTAMNCPDGGARFCVAIPRCG